MKIYVIRHGKTIANELRLYCGASDVSLTDLGRKELEEIKSIYKDINKNEFLFYSSGLKRANESIKELFGDVEIIEDKDLQEINFGDFEMKSYEELKNLSSYQEWISDAFNKKAPNGESGLDQYIRVKRALERIISNNKDVVIVTHGGTIYYIFNILINNKDNLYEISPENGRGYLFENKDNVWTFSKI